MFLKKWEQLPHDFQVVEVKEYYNYLNNHKFNIFVKRCFDIVVSIIMIVITAPFFLIISIVVKLDSPGPIFYRQKRITQYGKEFNIIKFRTMVDNADKIGNLVTISNDNRITKVGSFLRRVRLDEIPQLVNILLGDMSFVGARPEVKKYVDQYTNEMKATLLLPAGVTSLCSIKYKSEDDILSQKVDEHHSIDEVYVQEILPEKMKLNLAYIKSFSFFYDVKICIQTVINVLS